MEGLNKVFTSELQTYVSELKEVMFQRDIAIVKYRPTIKLGNLYCLMLQFSPIKNSGGFSSTIPSGYMCRSFRKT